MWVEQDRDLASDKCVPYMCMYLQPCVHAEADWRHVHYMFASPVIEMVLTRWHSTIVPNLWAVQCCRTAYEEIGEGADVLSINGREISLRAYCSQFNFRSGDQQACAAHCDQSSIVYAAPSLQRSTGSKIACALLCLYRRRWACSLVVSATGYSSQRCGPVIAVCVVTHERQVGVSALKAGRLSLMWYACLV
jgi:hypothetical protein